MADPESILRHIDEHGELETLEYARLTKLDHQKVVGTIKSLQSLGSVIEAEPINHKKWALTDEGQVIAENGSHEAVVYYAVPDDGIPQAELMKNVPNAKIGFSKAMSAGWIQIDKNAQGGPKVTKKISNMEGIDNLNVPSQTGNIEDVVQKCLQGIRDLQLESLTDQQKNEYKKRKLITEVVIPVDVSKM